MTGMLHIRIRTGYVITALCLLAAAIAAAGTVRMVDGTVIEGEVIEAREDGLRMRTPRGEVTFTWETLSPATRFRHQPIFRANYQAVLEGLPAGARTNRPLEERSQDPE